MATPPAEPFVVLADTREQVIPPFPEGVVVERVTLSEADYTTHSLLDIGRIERKSATDFLSTISWGRERFERELTRLAAFRFKCCVVEADLGEVMRAGRVHPHAVLGTAASMCARWDVPVLFTLNPSAAGRLMAGILRRWEKRLEA